MVRQHDLNVLTTHQTDDPTHHRSFASIAVAIFAVYMAIAIGLYVWFGVYFTPDLWVIALFLGAVVLGRTLTFLRDWIPFVLLIFGYEALRGVAGEIVLRGGYSREQHGRIQVESLITVDRAIGAGQLPTHWVQERFFEPSGGQWLGVMAILIYLMHFVLPLLFAFLLWVRRQVWFWQFSLAFLIMTYSAFIIFILFPAAPPWLASRWGYIDPVHDPTQKSVEWLMQTRLDHIQPFRLWTHASPNPVAAMPSLHAAFPWLVLLFAVRCFGWRGLIFLVYNAALWFSVVYLSQHWVIDIIGGIVWATLWFVIILLVWPWIVRAAVLPARLRSRFPARRPALVKARSLVRRH